MAQTTNKELTTKQTALWIIGCVIFAVFIFHLAYNLGTAETHEQCIAGDQTRDGQECWEYETRPGPDTGMAVWFGLMGITSLAMAVKLIWKALGWTLPGGLRRWLPIITLMSTYSL